MYGSGSHGDESEEEYDVFAEAEKDKVVKTFSKESATSRIKWHNRQDDENLETFKELALVDPTESSGATQKTLQHRASRSSSVPAGVLFSSSLASSIASQDTSSARSVIYTCFGMDISVLTDEEKEAIERARYCRQQLLRLKARRAAQEAGEADNSQILQQEEVEEWLANIELRLRQQTRKLGISAAELPIWIAPHLRRDLKIGNIASAAKAAAAAIRLKLSSNDMASGGSSSIGASSNTTPRDNEKAAAIAALTDLMEELEELSITSRDNQKDKHAQPQAGSKRTVRFQTPNSSPFQTPRSQASEPGGLIAFHRKNRLKKTTSEESKVQQPQPSSAKPVPVPAQQQPQLESQPLKTRVSALASSDVTRPSSCPGRSSSVRGLDISSQLQHPAVKSKGPAKGYVSRRRGSDSSPLAELYPT
ncbi:hypothetical protein GHT06_018740 [Daphnia sinensis]|uniref:Uncharacterized protein n=1 Tax=Daphnia sinensis TaxID=1820382 RepID=A0AAD5L504_9CRUS|nr:hypothetical protein GHT06_018740 [Daphnia sinensis]